MRHSDAIVEEVRRAREALAKEADYDIDKLGQALKAREQASGRQVVRLEPKRVPHAAPPVLSSAQQSHSPEK